MDPTLHEPDPIPRTWREKFRDAFRGIGCGMRGQSSFRVHVFVAVVVIVAAGVLHAELWEWCVLLLCIAGVLTAEMFNSALEHMAKVVEDKQNPQLADALDTGSAAVLFASIGAAVVGVIVFIHRIWVLTK
jgi:diacylglycerol kinase